jgi:hypothetical protein
VEKGSVGAPEHGGMTQERENSLKVSDLILRNQNQNFQIADSKSWIAEKVESGH